MWPRSDSSWGSSLIRVPWCLCLWRIKSKKVGVVYFLFTWAGTVDIEDIVTARKTWTLLHATDKDGGQSAHPRSLISAVVIRLLHLNLFVPDLSILACLCSWPCADPESFVKVCSNLITFFYLFIYLLVNEGIEDANTAINGPSSARQRNAI